MENYGLALKELRIHFKYTQREVANRVGVSHHAVSKWENGVNQPDIHTLRSICEMYATDFTETIDNGAFLKYIPTLNFTLINNLMHGWLDKAKIDLSIPLYTNTIFPIIQDYKLI